VAGTRGVFVGLALLLPLVGVAGGRALFRLDAEARVPVVEIALLRSLPLFAELPTETLERLAAVLRRREVPAGVVLLREGDLGDSYFAIADGEFSVSQAGGYLRTCRRGDGVGEIALLREIPRTATVLAEADGTAYELDRIPFLEAVTTHGATLLRAGSIADTRLATRPDDDPLGPV
jgi:CRP-like cAMP-binding protein